MRSVLAAAAVVALGLPLLAEDKGSKEELAKFTGTWRGVSMVVDGKEAPKGEAEKLKLVVKGEHYTLHRGDEEIEGTHKLDPSAKPKTIDAVRTKGPHKGEKMLGVYELTDDTFKVCFAPAGKKRPTEVKSEPGSGTRLIVLKREKP